MKSKFVDWLSALSEGRGTANFGDKSWNDLQLLIRIRDSAAHPKPQTVGVTVENLAAGLNLLPSTADIMAKLHHCIQLAIPSASINARFFADNFSQAAVRFRE